MMNINFSEKLKQLRKNKGITQQALADAIGEKRSIIANYESNNSTPGFEVLNKLSNFFLSAMIYTWMSLLLIGLQIWQNS